MKSGIWAGNKRATEGQQAVDREIKQNDIQEELLPGIWANSKKAVNKQALGK